MIRSPAAAGRAVHRNRLHLVRFLQVRPAPAQPPVTALHRASCSIRWPHRRGQHCHQLPALCRGATQKPLSSAACTWLRVYTNTGDRLPAYPGYPACTFILFQPAYAPLSSRFSPTMQIQPGCRSALDSLPPHRRRIAQRAGAPPPSSCDPHWRAASALPQPRGEAEKWVGRADMETKRGEGSASRGAPRRNTECIQGGLGRHVAAEEEIMVGGRADAATERSSCSQAHDARCRRCRPQRADTLARGGCPVEGQGQGHTQRSRVATRRRHSERALAWSAGSVGAGPQPGHVSGVGPGDLWVWAPLRRHPCSLPRSPAHACPPTSALCWAPLLPPPTRPLEFRLVCWMQSSVRILLAPAATGL